MKGKTFFGAGLIFGVAALAGCGGASNTNTVVNNTMNRNAANTTATNLNVNSNTAVVVNNNALNSNVTSEIEGGSSNFLKEAAQGGMTEVELGKLVASKAQNAEVKAFAQRMVTDHTKANDELKAVAAKKNVTLPTAVNAEQKEMMDELSKLSGADLDKKYVEMMVDDHEEDVEKFQKQADSGNDADVKAFAAKTLPTLKSHLEQIKSIDSKID
jgi:putative membrane protein